MLYVYVNKEAEEYDNNNTQITQYNVISQVKVEIFLHSISKLIIWELVFNTVSYQTDA